MMTDVHIASPDITVPKAEPVTVVPGVAMLEDSIAISENPIAITQDPAAMMPEDPTAMSAEELQTAVSQESAPVDMYPLADQQDANYGMRLLVYAALELDPRLRARHMQDQILATARMENEDRVGSENRE